MTPKGMLFIAAATTVLGGTFYVTLKTSDNIRRARKEEYRKELFKSGYTPEYIEALLDADEKRKEHSRV